MIRATIQRIANTDVLHASDGGITFSVPIRIKRRSGRKVITLPCGVEAPCPTESVTSFQRALARGFRWLRMIERGEVSSMGELARREHCDVSYVARMINLASLAPDIVAAILDEMLPEETALLDLAINPPVEWEEQWRALSGTNP